MAGIYVHIPFCKKACHYCDFHFSTSLSSKTDLVQAILSELISRKDYLNNKVIETIYFGGGTPSLLSENELQLILNTIYQHFNAADTLEITLEANPDDLTEEKLSTLKKARINRLSIGIQSFRDCDLKLMNRSHTAEQALSAVKTAQDVGISNITVDLIYAIPELSNEAWVNNLTKAFELQVPHISSYCLTIEPKTVFQHQIVKGNLKEINEEIATQQFNILVKETEQQGYLHYEISNFCLPDQFSKHNSNYWKGVHYLGVGPSAHSYDGISRQWNIANNHQYTKAINAHTNYFEREELSENTRYNEYIMTSLRTMWGCDEHYIKSEFPNYYQLYLQKIDTLLKYEGIQKQDNMVTLTKKGKFICDKISEELFIV